MRRARLRLRLNDQGLLEIVDPGFDTLSLLEEVRPGYRILESALEVRAPRVIRAHQTRSSVALTTLEKQSESVLWEAHRSAMDINRNSDILPAPAKGEASLLSLKRELARRMLMNCHLCAHRCGVDRTRGELGVCRLGTEATAVEHFVHISEESPINPSLVLNLAGCGMRCSYCQQNALLDPAVISGEPIDPELWSRLDTSGARTLSFVGGNPDESLYAILRFLEGMPEHWSLPLVWNCHAYGTTETLKLLDGLIDVYVPDFKYGSERCGQTWSAVNDYPNIARAAVSAMVTQEAIVIVRLLVLPGHNECCHFPVLEFLATLPGNRLSVSVRGQYCPDWRITTTDGNMARRPSNLEIDAVRSKAAELGLTLIA
jgi:putative pyruvate formate lyase activating enzyme